MIRFFIDPEHAKEAVLKGRCLLVEISGDRYQYRKVTVIDRPKQPLKPSDEQEVRVSAGSAKK